MPPRTGVTPQDRQAPDASDRALAHYLNLKLAALGAPVCESTADPEYLQIAGPLLRNIYQKDQLLAGRLCPVDSRIQEFLEAYIPGPTPRLPGRTFVLDRPGLARMMSVPAASDRFVSSLVSSYRTAQGVLHNPVKDRRTTQGVFHVAEGGYPVPADKRAVPVEVFGRLLAAAVEPPAELCVVPYTADQPEPARLMLSLLLRPLVSPANGRDGEKRMEIRFFAPASLVSNLDFVETIFGNGGDPFLPENDAALDVHHWTGHTGCVILAPHLTGLRKVDLGLPHYDEATERQRRDGMCWKEEDELYNLGSAFKVTARDHRGVMVTLIADNYFGYCKKEVKTQISFSANLAGMCEEEHAGGTFAAPAYVLGQEFRGDHHRSLKGVKFGQALAVLGELAEQRPEGYAVDRRFPSVVYVPESAEFHVRGGYVRWPRAEGEGFEQLSLSAEQVYVLPSGYRVWLEKQQGSTNWRLIGAVAHGTVCHKPCTVSGGGKSEISKSIAPSLLQGPVFVREYRSDMEQVEAVLARDYSGIYREPQPAHRAGRPILSTERSLGSVIKLLTPSSEYTDEHNEWVRRLPQTIRQIVFTVKRYYRPEWGEDWRSHFTVDRVNGYLGHELKYDNMKLVANYLRVGFDPSGAWRIFKLRPDFHPAVKLQMEDDITASTVVPREWLTGLDPKYSFPSVKLLKNCEGRLFQRPDDAIHRGFDDQAEADIASQGAFLSNFEPLTLDQARSLVDHVVAFDEYTPPMQRLLSEHVRAPRTEFVVSSAHPRLVDGVPTKNPRYLQLRPDLADPRAAHLVEVCARLDRETPVDQPIYFPVHSVLAGRRGNPADPAIGLPPLAVFNPIHYQELPELFMDFICSLTGKSPSTTGFGSEGALTKGPFNALPPVVDLNNALVSYILTGYAGFTTAAGSVGPNFRVDHDISMLVPELWCRIYVHEREPEFLIANGYLEKLEDFEYEGRTVLASRLGYRITASFVDHFLGRLFESPREVLAEELLRPEKQDLASFVQGVEAIAEGQRRVAQLYFDDGSVEWACPPLKALLHVMVHGQWEGMDENHPDFRAMFTREAMLSSQWYADRLKAQQGREIALWQRHVADLEAFRRTGGAASAGFPIEERLAEARARLLKVTARGYEQELVGTLGADPALGG
ncbi:MAG: hypothetical protein KJZ79_08785 [Bryobacteraceae bacterium]|nr:hypothetical protein [Bryobacteraceae bacterium]